MAASDISDLGPGFKFLLDPMERRNPIRNKVGTIARSEEALRAREQALRMLVPADTFAIPK
jgi:hypothetical protein